MTITLIRNSALSAAVAAALSLLLAMSAFFMFEPKVGFGATANDEFLVTQTVTEEISFVLAAANVAMTPSLAGITGGTSNGTTSVRVRTNNAAGYNMTLAFSSTTAMNRNGGGGSINNYNPASASAPDYTFAAETFAQFGYTVTASTSGDLATYFRDDGAACATGAGNTGNTCWMGPSTTARTVINRTTATGSTGATTTLAFRINIPSNPIPAIQTGTYTATATLTATTN